MTLKNHCLSRPALLMVTAVFSLALSGGQCFAEKADRDKPMNIESDHATVDDATHLSTFEGNVVMTQGTMVMHANKMIVKQDDKGFQHGTAYGNPVTFRQKREGAEEYIEGYGQRVEYDGTSEKLELFNQARIKRGQDEMRGSYISYDSRTEFFKTLGGGKDSADANNPQGRARAVIQPKTKSAAKPSPPSSVPLKPADTIAAPRAE